MFDDIIELIEKEEFSAAETALQEYVNSNDAKIQSSAYYLIGYINTRWKNKNKSDVKARRSLLYNLNSEYPNRNAYALYADLEEALKKSLDLVTTDTLRQNKSDIMTRNLIRNMRKDEKLIYEKLS